MVFSTVGECTHIVDVDFGVFDIAKQVISLRFAKVGKLFDNIVHVHLFILGIQVGRDNAVWILPVPAKGLFLLMVYNTSSAVQYRTLLKAFSTQDP